MVATLYWHYIKY